MELGISGTGFVYFVTQTITVNIKLFSKMRAVNLCLQQHLAKMPNLDLETKIPKQANTFLMIVFHKSSGLSTECINWLQVLVYSGLILLF